MKYSITSLLFCLVAIFTADTAQAHSSSRYIKLDLNDQHLRGKQRIYLKREIQRQYPGLRLDNFTIEKVKLRAKSKHGRGEATLRVGDYYSDEKIIRGRPKNFHKDRARTYYNTRFSMRSEPQSRGPWQLLLRGNIKVDSVKLRLRRIDHREFDRPRYRTKPGWYHNDDHKDDRAPRFESRAGYSRHRH